MPMFSYQVRDRGGKISKGKIESETKNGVASKLQSMGYTVLDISPATRLSLNMNIGSRVKPKAVAIFARQFSTMINAGLSLTKCLSILNTQTESVALKVIIGELARDVESGVALSEAMAKHPKAFTQMFVSMVKAGETGGVLDDVLNRVATSMESDLALKAKIKSAMSYPIVMLCIVLLILAAMMIFVIPTFQKMFTDMGGTLPLPTQILIDISSFLTGWGGPFTIIAGVAIVFGFNRWKVSSTGKYIWDGAKLKMPIFGSMIRKMSLSKFTRTFGALISSGVPILTALEIVADTAGNSVVAREVQKARTSIKEGEPIAKPLSESPIFPGMLTQMVAVGEETGSLDVMLSKIADFYDEEVATAVDGITSLIEPIMMVVLGGVVGGMVIALYMPMFNLITLIK